MKRESREQWERSKSRKKSREDTETAIKTIAKALTNRQEQLEWKRKVVEAAIRRASNLPHTPEDVLQEANHT